MKNYIALFVAVSLVALGCTETEYIEVEKLIRDTVIQEKFIDRYFSNTDTVEIPVTVTVPVPVRSQVDSVIITEIDTVYLPKYDTVYVDKIVYVDRVDSVFITKLVIDRDTVVIRERSFYDTLYIYPGRGVYSVPDELQPIVDAFFEDCAIRGLNPYGDQLFITVEPIDAVLQSYSYHTYGQLNIVVNGNQTTDESFLPIYRELSRWLLKNEYSADPTNPMNQYYPSNKIRYSNRKQFKSEIDKMF